MKKNCKHENKVYANYVLCSYPPQYPWICTDCGYKGCDQSELGNTPSYEDIEKKFEKKTLRDKSFSLMGNPDAKVIAQEDVKESLKEIERRLVERFNRATEIRTIIKQEVGEELVE